MEKQKLNLWVSNSKFSLIYYEIALLNRKKNFYINFQVGNSKCDVILRNSVSKLDFVTREFRTSANFTAKRARVPECPLSDLRVPLECLWSVLWVKKVCNISRNGLVNGFIKFLKIFSEYIFYITLILSPFLEKNMFKLYHVLLARRNRSESFQELSLNILQIFRKRNMMESRAFLLRKLQFYSWSVQFFSCSCRMAESLVII